MTPPIISEVKKPLRDSKIAFITTAGIYLKEDKPFDTKKSKKIYLTLL